MEILSAEFVISNTKVDKCPQGICFYRPFQCGQVQFDKYADQTS